MKLEEESNRHWIQRIQDVYQTGDLQLAEELCLEAVEQTNRNPQILEAAGLIAFQKNDWARSVQWIEEAMFVRRLSFSAQLVLAKAYYCIGKREQAQIAIAFLVEMVDQVPCTLLPDLTVTAAQWNNYEAALAVCRHASCRHPSDDNAFYGAAFYMYKLGYPIRSIQNVIQKAMDLNPESQLYRMTLSVICSVREQWDEAYQNACQLSDEALSHVPHSCFFRPLSQLFRKFDDQRRLQLLNQAIPENDHE